MQRRTPLAALLWLTLLLCTTSAIAQNSIQPHNAVATPPDSIPTILLVDTGHVQALDEVLEFPGTARRNENIVARADSGTWLLALQERLDKECNGPLFETSQLGICVYDLTDDHLIYAINQRHRMRPASSMKVVTSVSGLHYLGGDYTFKTRLYIKGDVVDSTKTLNGNVYVVGGMDPMLDGSDLKSMASAIKDMGIDSIRGNLYIDLTMREDKPYGWGWCWDDDYGPLSALTYNAKDTFNAHWMSALTEAGVWYGDSTEIKKTTLPSGVKLVATREHTIDQVLGPLLKRSNNIYAESLFYNLAAKSGTKYAGRKQAETYINKLITNFGYKTENYQIADGSGVSLYDYVTPQLLVRFLRHAWTEEKIRAHFYPALPIAGVDGTLAGRMRGTKAQNNVHAKTGTVNGISSLTGYCKATNGHDLAFSIINTGLVQNSTGRNFQDRICRILCETTLPPPAVDSTAHDSLISQPIADSINVVNATDSTTAKVASPKPEQPVSPAPAKQDVQPAPANTPSKEAVTPTKEVVPQKEADEKK